MKKGGGQGSAMPSGLQKGIIFHVLLGNCIHFGAGTSTISPLFTKHMLLNRQVPAREEKLHPDLSPPRPPSRSREQGLTWFFNLWSEKNHRLTDFNGCGGGRTEKLTTVQDPGGGTHCSV